MAYIKGLTYAEQKTLWACNDKIARENAGRFAHMNLREALTPAILAYDGIQYAPCGINTGSDSVLCALFRGRISGWQEAYMERLNREYIEPLNGSGSASDRFWALEERIKQDRCKPSVLVEMSKSKLCFLI